VATADATPSDSPAVERAVRDAALALDRDAERLGASVAAVLHAEVPDAPGDPASLEETSRACTATLRALLASWRRGEPAGRVEPPPELRYSVGVLARTGVPLRPLQRMCHHAHGAFLDAWDAELGRARLAPGVQLAASRRAQRLTFAWFDALGTRLAELHEEERARLARTPAVQRREAVQAALAGGASDVDALSRACGYDLRQRHLGVVAWRGTALAGPPEDPLGGQPQLEAALTELASALGAGRPLVVAAAAGVAWGWIGLPAERPAAAVEAAAPARQDGLSLAIGAPETGLDGFRDTHEDARATARVMMLRGRRAGSVGRYEGVELPALLAGDLRRARRFVRRRLGALATDDDEHARLRATLLAFLEEDRGRTATARRLGVHANTVGNRVRRCEELLPPDGRPTELQAALLVAHALGGAVLRPTAPG
jgi:hypothetical protein